MRVLLIIACIIIAGCQQGAQKGDAGNVDSNGVIASVSKAKPSKLNEQWQTAQIEFFEFEGGFFGLTTTDNKKYLPINLPKELQQHNAKVRFIGKVKSDMMTIQQWGTPLKITKIELIEKGVSKKELSH